MCLFECYKTRSTWEDAITSFSPVFLPIAWSWKKHLFWRDLQQKMFVPVGFLMDIFCYRVLFSPPCFFPIFFLLKDEKERKRRRKNTDKQTPLPRLQIQTEKGATEVWMVWNTTAELAENVCTSILFENVWCCVCMDFSTFWINKNTKRGIQIWLFFFHQGIISIFWKS